MDRIIIFGNISCKKDLCDIYSKASIFVLTSRFEGFPLVIPEALANGCYVITTDSFPATKEIINKDNGIVVDGSQEELMDVLKKTINQIENNEINSSIIMDNANKTLSYKVISKQLAIYLDCIR